MPPLLSTPPPHYSVVAPVYNGTITVEELFERTKAVFTQLGSSFEMILVEDNGQDNSWQKITQLHKNYPQQVRGIKLTRNYGQHNATLCGFKYARGSYIITIDDDLQAPPEEIPKLLHCFAQTQADVVYGVYPIKKHSLVRRIGSYTVRKLFKLGAGTQNQGSSFRLIARPIAEQLTRHSQSYVYIDELLQWYTTHIAATPVEHYASKKGKSGYPLLKLIVFTLNLIINYTAIPLRLMTYSGLFFAVVFFCVGLYYIYEKLFWGAQLGFTSLITAIFFTTGLIMFCLGIIGEYLRRLYLGQNQQPQYTIRETLL